jgi:RNA polymerase sigma-70 factor (ECF subfamily)
MNAPVSEIARARHQFLELVAEIRPELHRYCTRLTGSVVDGEDIVQDALGRAFYALSMAGDDVPPLRPWLFRIAHNAAIDHLRRAARRDDAFDDDAPDAVFADVAADPESTRLALHAFMELPVRQRSAVILKDVLGQSLDEIAAAMETTVPAVKAALVRGRSALRRAPEPRPPVDRSAEQRALLDAYVAAFNARDWTALRAMLEHDARLDLVSQARREGPAVGHYFARYDAVTDLRAEVGVVDDRDAILVFAPAASTRPAYFILLEWRGGRVVAIRDYRYVPYIADEIAATR